MILKFGGRELKTTTVRVVMYSLQWTWGIIQNLLGLLLMLCIRKKALRPFHGAVVVEYHDQAFTKRFGTFALGMFIFYKNTDQNVKQNILTHEYGHTIQSMIYGPFFIPIVGFCSIRWALSYSKNREKYNALNIFYADKYPEKQANYWGEKILGHRGIYW